MSSNGGIKEPLKELTGYLFLEALSRRKGGKVEAFEKGTQTRDTTTARTSLDLFRRPKNTDGSVDATKVLNLSGTFTDATAPGEAQVAMADLVVDPADILPDAMPSAATLTAIENIVAALQGAGKDADGKITAELDLSAHVNGLDEADKAVVKDVIQKLTGQDKEKVPAATKINAAALTQVTEQIPVLKTLSGILLFLNALKSNPPTTKEALTALFNQHLNGVVDGATDTAQIESLLTGLMNKEGTGLSTDVTALLNAANGNPIAFFEKLLGYNAATIETALKDTFGFEKYQEPDGLKAIEMLLARGDAALVGQGTLPFDLLATLFSTINDIQTTKTDETLKRNLNELVKLLILASREVEGNSQMPANFKQGEFNQAMIDEFLKQFNTAISSYKSATPEKQSDIAKYWNWLSLGDKDLTVDSTSKKPAQHFKDRLNALQGKVKESSTLDKDKITAVAKAVLNPDPPNPVVAQIYLEALQTFLNDRSSGNYTVPTDSAALKAYLGAIDTNIRDASQKNLLLQMAAFDIKADSVHAKIPEKIRDYLAIFSGAQKIAAISDKTEKENTVAKLGVTIGHEPALNGFIFELRAAFAKPNLSEQETEFATLKNKYAATFLKEDSINFLKNFDPAKDTQRKEPPLTLGVQQGSPLASHVKDTLIQNGQKIEGNTWEFRTTSFDQGDGKETQNPTGDDFASLLLVFPKEGQKGLALKPEVKDGRPERFLVFEVEKGADGSLSLKKTTGQVEKPQATQGPFVIQLENKQGGGSGVNVVVKQGQSTWTVDIIANDKSGFTTTGATGFPPLQSLSSAHILGEGSAINFQAIQVNAQGEINTNTPLPGVRRVNSGFYELGGPAPQIGGVPATPPPEDTKIKIIDHIKGGKGLAENLKVPRLREELVGVIDALQTYNHARKEPYANGQTPEQVKTGLAGAKTLVEEIGKTYADGKTPDAAKINDLDAQLVMARAVADQAQRDLIRKTSGNKDDKEFEEIIAALMAGQIPLGVALIALMKFLKRQKVNRLADLMTKLHEINQAQSNMRPEDAGPGGARLNAMQSEASIIQAQISSVMGEMTQTDERTFQALAQLDNTIKFGIQRMA